MEKNSGIPKEVIKELKPEKEPEKPIEVTIIVEKHQAKIPIPVQIRLELDMKKGQKCLVKYDRKKRELICWFKK